MIDRRYNYGTSRYWRQHVISKKKTFHVDSLSLSPPLVKYYLSNKIARNIDFFKILSMKHSKDFHFNTQR